VEERRMRQEIQDVLEGWCWCAFYRKTFRITRFGCNEPLAEITVEDFLRTNYPEDKALMGLDATDIPEGTEYLLTSGAYVPRYNPAYDPRLDERRKATHFARYARKGALLDYVTWLEIGLFALSLRRARANYTILTNNMAERLERSPPR
jgi:hypothetical protein